ncbi:MAG TPA: isoprenylcysteine carboxylmethyltransferase family protein [Xanthobacteraceae bacterium]|nr:isoprenylcysteine carboxylmethyltransferase family protein [Xanthobacteraceae bacterium]
MIRPSPFTLAAVAAWCALLVAWIPGYLAAAGPPRASPQVVPRALQFAATALLFAGFVLLFGRALPGHGVRVTPPDAPLGALGAALALAGIAFAIWARRVLGRNWSGLVMGVRDGHELVQTGPYAIVRHPIYTGLALAMLGTALTIGTLFAWLGVAAGLCGILLRVAIEERLMAAEFGAAHAAYRQRTRKLVPFVW